MHTAVFVCICQSGIAVVGFFKEKRPMGEGRKKKIATGTTLVELVIALFVFSIIVLATTEVFSSSFVAKKEVESVQKRYNLAFEALGELGKYIASSTIMDYDGDLTTIGDSSDMKGTNPDTLYTEILLYNYSTRECAHFRFFVGNYNLQVRKLSMLSGEDYTLCSGSYLDAPTGGRLQPGWEMMTKEFIQGRFIRRTYDSTPVPLANSGIVMIYAEVFAPREDNPALPESKGVPIQLTVSLRDYLVR